MIWFQIEEQTVSDVREQVLCNIFNSITREVKIQYYLPIVNALVEFSNTSKE